MCASPWEDWRLVHRAQRWGRRQEAHPWCVEAVDTSAGTASDGHYFCLGSPGSLGEGGIYTVFIFFFSWISYCYWNWCILEENKVPTIFLYEVFEKRPASLSIYTSIYQAVIPLKEVSQDKARQCSWRHYSLVTFCEYKCFQTNSDEFRWFSEN